ncbi:MAG: BT4734/BF3469 family protein [Flavobacterium sp.]
MQTAEVLPESMFPRFSYYRTPITNVTPADTITIFDAYVFIRDIKFLKNVNELQAIKDKEAAKIYKKNHFDYVTFSGTFSTRKDTNLIKHSSLITIDLDDLENPQAIKKLLLEDKLLETALLFFSPSGNGIKWIVEIDIKVHSHFKWFIAISNYLMDQHQLKVDPSGKDVSRACFIPHDKECFINPKYHIKYE